MTFMEMDGPEAFKRLAEEIAAAQGYRFGMDSSGYMNELAERAYMNQADPDEAEAAFRTFIGEMISASNSIPGYRDQNPGVLGEQTFDWARNKLCPLPPIC